ncbi:MAG TPA: hypothetical protein VLV81_01430 [Acidimicrobiia bacterium]|nr:hypothetical protein [Acidimicrobiia bacterium]
MRAREGETNAGQAQYPEEFGSEGWQPSARSSSFVGEAVPRQETRRHQETRSRQETRRHQETRARQETRRHQETRPGQETRRHQEALCRRDTRLGHASAAAPSGEEPRGVASGEPAVSYECAEPAALDLGAGSGAGERAGQEEPVGPAHGEVAQTSPFGVFSGYDVIDGPAR